MVSNSYLRVIEGEFMSEEKEMKEKTRMDIIAQRILDGYTETPAAFQYDSILIIQEKLREPIHPAHIGVKKKGSEIPFIKWFVAVQYLNDRAPGWSHEIRRIDNIGGKCVITVRVSIPCAEGVVFREATGSEDEDYDAYGDTFSNAEAQAIKRAFAKFGFAYELYNNPGKVLDDVSAWKAGRYNKSATSTKAAQTASNPSKQTSQGNSQGENKAAESEAMITDSQLDYLEKIIGKRKDLDYKTTVLEISGGRTDEAKNLTKKEAMAAINKYQ